MKIKTSSLICLWVFFLISFTEVHSQSKATNNPSNGSSVNLDSLFYGKKLIRFKFHAVSKDQINTYLTNIVNIENVTIDLEVFASATKSQFQQFLLAHIAYEITESSAPKAAATMATTVAQMATWDKYPTYDVYIQMMAQFQANYPNLCHIDTILATTPGGHSILVAKIKNNVNTHEAVPQFLYTSSMHGDEVTGYVLMLRLMDYLLSNYNVLPKVTNLLNNVEIWICPSANPDGTYATNNATIGDSPLSTRENHNTMDLNRNYPDPRTGDPVSPYGPIQPETYAFMAFADLHNFTMSANFHGGSEVFNYPFDTWTSPSKTHADDNWWQYIGKQYIDTSRILLTSYMSSVTASGFSEGGDWYVITGGRQDYMNWWKKCREVTIEISNVKVLSGANLPTYWNYNYKSFLNYMEQSTFGIKGIVTDSISGTPLNAMVWVNNHDRDSSHVYSSLPLGDYHRPIYAGTYSVTYSAPCHKSKTVNNIAVTNANSATLNVQLAPGVTSSFSIDTSTTNCNGTVAFNNFASSGSNYAWDFGDGTHSNVANPIHAYATNGNYSVKLVVSGACGADSTTLPNIVHVNLAPAPLLQGDSICNSDSVKLTAIGSGLINWYSVPNGGTVLDTGAVFYTPIINTTTTYYAESQVPQTSQYVGKLDNSSTGANLNANQALIFNCYAPVTLVSVKVYAQAAGVRTIELRDSNGTVLQTANVNLPAGESRATLNFSLPVGNKLQLGASGTNINLYRNSAGVTYPYSIANVISIFTTTASSNPTLYYYFFYNWEIQGQACKSARAAVQALVNHTPTASFTYSASINTITFSNNTLNNALNYTWKFGDGATSNASNPTHAYSSSGTYNVTLIASNACGTDSITNIINTGGYAPVPDFYASDTLIHMGDTIHFVDQSINTPSNWTWSFPNAIPNSANIQNPAHIKYPLPGYYNVSLLTSNNYGSNTTTKTLYIHVLDTATSINEDAFLRDLVIYPNPVTHTHFSMMFRMQQAAKVTVKLINNLSKEVYCSVNEFYPGLQSISIPTEKMASGIYSCNIYYDKYVITRKLIIIK